MILNSNKDLIVSKRTLYNYQEKEYLDTLNIDLPRKVRYKKRVQKQDVVPKNTKHRIGRTYDDLKKYKIDFFIQNKYDVEVVQMDTVEGIKGENEAVLLTLLFTSSNFSGDIPYPSSYIFIVNISFATEISISIVMELISPLIPYLMAFSTTG